MSAHISFDIVENRITKHSAKLLPEECGSNTGTFHAGNPAFHWVGRNYTKCHPRPVQEGFFLYALDIPSHVHYY
jgi:hypothetical protein